MKKKQTDENLVSFQKKKKIHDKILVIIFFMSEKLTETVKSKTFFFNI